MNDALRNITPDERGDLQTMSRVRDGDLEAFSQLLRRHRPRVENFLARLFGDRQKAEDGAQEVFLRLWTARERYTPTARFTTYLYGISTRYWLDERRKAGARPLETGMESEEEVRAGTPLPPAPSLTEPEYHLLLRYRQWRIRQALDQLPEIYRVVFVLGHLEGHKLAEIAEILGIPVGTVKSRMHGATRMLRDSLRADGNEDDDDL